MSDDWREPGADPPPRAEPAEEETPPPERFVRWGLVFYGVMGAAAVLWRIGFHQEPILFASEEAAAGGLHWQRDVALGLGVAAVVVVVSHVTTRATAWGRRLAHALGSSLSGISTPNALLLALASGMAEEAFFRGALQPRVGLVVASLCFGLLHFVPRREFLPWTVFAVLAGFGFGALFEWTGNLVAPIVAHVVVNGVNLPLLIRDYGGRPAAP